MVAAVFVFFSLGRQISMDFKFGLETVTVSLCFDSRICRGESHGVWWNFMKSEGNWSFSKSQLKQTSMTFYLVHVLILAFDWNWDIPNNIIESSKLCAKLEEDTASQRRWNRLVILKQIHVSAGFVQCLDEQNLALRVGGRAWIFLCKALHPLQPYAVWHALPVQPCFVPSFKKVCVSANLEGDNFVPSWSMWRANLWCLDTKWTRQQLTEIALNFCGRAHFSDFRQWLSLLILPCPGHFLC